MPPEGTREVAHEVSGLIRELDVPGRQLTVLVDGTEVCFDVAPDCTVLLHDDRVKLRLLQPRDHARVVYTESADGPVAHAIRVGWWLTGSEHARPAAWSDEAGTVRSVG